LTQLQNNLDDQKCVRFEKKEEKLDLSTSFHQNDDLQSISQEFDQVLKYLANSLNDQLIENMNGNQLNNKQREKSISSTSASSYTDSNNSESHKSIIETTKSDLILTKTTRNDEDSKKDELIKSALIRLKEANIKKLIIKAFTDDNCTKSFIIDENMSIYDIILILLNKNHCEPDINTCIVEYLPIFNMGIL
jgi:uncharacterized membrane-anchored protein YjiN (DUF445 family)